MKIIVTGAAGFIGSHLCERLLADVRNEVIGIDGFIPSSTDVWIRERNMANFAGHPRFTFVRSNLLDTDWERQLDGVDVVYHLAGMPGVRSSWGADFHTYVTNNIMVTQQLLEGCRRQPVNKLVYASTSSVYGEKTGQVGENASAEPLSPYGVSKLTGEQLCRVYERNDGLPLTVLRFFTVYGPRQRPDMAFHLFIRHALEGKPLPINGDGKQTRDFTYVSDCVEAVSAVAYADGVTGQTINIGGKERASVLDCIAMLEKVMGRPIDLDFRGKPRGEPKHTWADISKARSLLGYEPKVDLLTGLAREVEHLTELYRGRPGG